MFMVSPEPSGTAASPARLSNTFYFRGPPPGANAARTPLRLPKLQQAPCCIAKTAPASTPVSQKLCLTLLHIETNSKVSQRRQRCLVFRSPDRNRVPDMGKRKESHMLRAGRLLRPALVGLFVATLSWPAFAQKDTGSVVGTVQDPSGAVVTNAQVQVRDVDRGSVSDTKTNANGEYVASP